MKATDRIRAYYAHLYRERFGRPPSERRSDKILARTLLSTAGGFAEAKRVLDFWFASTDPWYEAHGYALKNVFMAINRLIGTGVVEPRGTPEQRHAVRKFAAALVEPRLRVVR